MNEMRVRALMPANKSKSRLVAATIRPNAWLLIVVPMRSADKHLRLSFKNFPGILGS
jgi:hypothetical protein